MNERIKALAEQAGGEFYEGFAGSTNFVKFAENDFEKFAELIVRECAQVAADFVPGYGLEPFSKRFNEHYGVEKMNEQIEDKVSYNIPIVCIAVILVLTFMMVISK